MKFSKSWLDEWVNTGLDAEALAEQITMAGLEVDDITPVAGAFSQVLVGQVVECGQHPDADKLRVTKVDVGGDELLDIVCGAPNCRQGLKVAVAVVGAVLPGDFTIKKAKLRGQPSHGMLCSYGELGMDVDSDGIIELPADAPIGAGVRDYLHLDDAIIEVDLTPNRADCLSLAGLAREVGVLNQQDVNWPEIPMVPASIDDKVEIRLDAPAACPRYLGRVVKNIDVKAETPLWMQEKLRRCGIRSIDPVVDITNFVLLEWGQPMHAFDLARLDGGIVVRQAEQGEKLTLLDGNEVSLNGDTLVIADQSKAVAMAGIFGGEATGVNENTRDVLLECAFFSPLSITGRARSYGLHTDSSHRFERGVDYRLQHKVMERATALLLAICGGEAGPVVEAVSEAHLPARNSITLRHGKLTRLLGINIPATQVTDMLARLGLDVTPTGDDWQVEVPSYRFDIAIEEDLIEEVARIYGYNRIPNVAPQARLDMSRHREANLPLNRLKDALVDLGYQEAITYSFVDPEQQRLLFPEMAPLVLPNPIAADMSAMRVSLWPGLVQAAVYNQNRQQSRLRLFEQGLTFIPDESAENGVRQTPVLAGLLLGPVVDEHWDMAARGVDFFDLKGDLESLLALGADELSFSFVRTDIAALHPGQSAALQRAGRQVGLLGALHPSLLKKLGLKSQAYVFEVALSALTERAVPEAGEVSRFPANRRDLALVVEQSTAAGDILDLVRKVGGDQLVGLNLFDVYQGQGIADGKKSLALSLVLQDTQRTLEEKEIADTVARIVSALSDEFNASLRD
ncbi:phenylalanine--tRNA ligase subunit beta [Zobellella denitrificans]|uniref:phenylalanine--tRNA ligase subunit beta n=1 Tax=Zobellella denitrificans TaxID=347534 RepID=UPI000B8BD98C|nr:phenylalanine--tRNA ligase subunit beta [Zobellella denitrificans]OXS16844.1 phenylalanine--tRNA ligase subunit beta [Zobellella denitrificans]